MSPINPLRKIDMNEQEIDTELELLAAGELCGERQAKVLASLEDQPLRWKQCALLLLEDRQLHKGIREASNHSPTMLIEKVDCGSTGESHPKANELAQPVVANRQRSTRAWIAVAASLLVGLVGGITLGRISTVASRDDQPMAEEKERIVQQSNRDAAPSHADEEYPTLQTAGGEEVQLVGYVRITDLDQPDNSFVTPIVRDDEDRTGILRRPSAELPNRIVKQINRSGWKVHNDRKVMSVHFANGDQVEIPMTQVRYQYVGRPVL